MKYLVAALLFLVLVGVAFAEYKEDKGECERLARGYYALANLRDNYDKGQIYDEVMEQSITKGYSTEDTVVVLYGVLYVHAHPDLTKEQIKKKAYKDCMELSGHKGV